MPRERRAEIALLLRDGYFSLNDLTFRLNMPFAGENAELIRKIFDGSKWMPEIQSATAGTTLTTN